VPLWPKSTSTDYADLARAVPNLSFTSFGGPGQFEHRNPRREFAGGISHNGFTSMNVPINVLNVYTTGATEPRFFDIDRVEGTPRGPQGTIYGASSMAAPFTSSATSPTSTSFPVKCIHPWEYARRRSQLRRGQRRESTHARMALRRFGSGLCTIMRAVGSIGRIPMVRLPREKSTITTPP